MPPGAHYVFLKKILIKTILIIFWSGYTLRSASYFLFFTSGLATAA
jgi:hypothetical protein